MNIFKQFWSWEWKILDSTWKEIWKASLMFQGYEMLHSFLCPSCILGFMQFGGFLNCAFNSWKIAKKERKKITLAGFFPPKSQLLVNVFSFIHSSLTCSDKMHPVQLLGFFVDGDTVEKMLYSSHLWKWLKSGKGGCVKMVLAWSDTVHTYGDIQLLLLISFCGFWKLTLKKNIHVVFYSILNKSPFLWLKMDFQKSGVNKAITNSHCLQNKNCLQNKTLICLTAGNPIT